MNELKKVSILTGGGGSLLTAFTIAEILLSLTIIGVVAAITLPSLTGNINERTWNTQRKALYARFSQAIALMPALNGYGTLTEDENGSVTADTAAETFVTDGLAKVLKINNICDSEHLADCGIPEKITLLNSNTTTSIPKTLAAFNPLFNGTVSYGDSGVASYSQTDTNAAAFETANGESIVIFYNPNCSSMRRANKLQPTMCANFIYDLNGSKGPNTVGKDIGFMTAFYPSDPIIVAPIPIKTINVTDDYLGRFDTACREKVDSESRATNIDELSSIFVNKALLPTIAVDGYRSNTRNGQYYMVLHMYAGTIADNHNLANYANLICVKRN